MVTAGMDRREIGIFSKKTIRKANRNLRTLKTCILTKTNSKLPQGSSLGSVSSMMEFQISCRSMILWSVSRRRVVAVAAIKKTLETIITMAIHATATTIIISRGITTIST